MTMNKTDEKVVQALRDAADRFHEIGMAISAETLSPNNAILAEKIRENRRTPAQLSRIAADGFELCVRALGAMGASDVTIHECGEAALGETPWSSDGDDA